MSPSSVSPSVDTSSQPTLTASASFATTHWSVVLAAGGDSPESTAALERLCRAYWYPLYVYVRRSGYGAHDAQDLTQAFFSEILRKNYFRAADRERGKFRSFLLTSLRHFLTHEWEKARAGKRGGGVSQIHLDDPVVEDCYRQECGTGGTPERLYDRAWALRLFEQGLARLRQECVEQGKTRQFDQLKNYLTQEPAPDGYTAAGASLGLSPNAVAVAVHRLRRRYAFMVREAIAQTVGKPSQVDEELGYLISLICD